MKRVFASAALVLGLALASAALAHPKVLSSTPAPAASVAAGPTEIRILFSEVVYPKFSGVVIRDAAAKVVKAGAARVDAKDKRLLIVPLTGPLPAGTYTVEWHAVSADTHRVKGKFAFTVRG